MPFGPKYRILYDDEGVVVGKKEMAALAKKPAPPVISANVDVRKHLPKVPKPPQPAGESRGLTLAKEMAAKGIKDKNVLFKAVYDFYKTNTNRTEQKILKDCRRTIAFLENNKLI